ncbi:MAG: energy-coupling factor transporter transmembrane protein EcfT [Candidatus Micrarchaeota archaeon]
MLRYHPGGSIVHRAGAGIKLVALLAATISLVILPASYSVLFLFAIAGLYPLSGVSLSRTVSDHRLVFVFSLSAFAFHWGDSPAGAFNYAYLCSLFLLSFLFVFTTPPSQIDRALRGFGLPKTTAFMLSTAIASVPYFERKAAKVRIAQASRGSKALLPLVLPVLHSLFRRARKLAISLETRGFQP